eukprot:7795014-Pyramimonas_sp.AAC.1
MLVHTSPRMLEVERVVSHVIGTGKSILAGCSQSVPWAKTYLHGVLVRAHSRLPVVSIRSCIDDITQYMQGTRKYIVSALPAAAAQFCRDVGTLG